MLLTSNDVFKLDSVSNGVTTSGKEYRKLTFYNTMEGYNYIACLFNPKVPVAVDKNYKLVFNTTYSQDRGNGLILKNIIEV